MELKKKWALAHVLQGYLMKGEMLAWERVKIIFKQYH